jgi:hypothetical protein
VKVSMMRPYADISGAMTDDNNLNSFFRAEYPMARWLEAQGYDVTYTTTLDVHRSGKTGARNQLLDHRVFLSVGHDEYWTQEMRDAITAARDKGVHVGFFSSNTSYWRVRLESDPYTNTPESVIVTYKTTESGPADPSGHATGTWRDPTGVNNPENGLLGAQYVGDNDEFFFPLQVSAEEAKDRIYRNTGLEDMPPGTVAYLGQQIVGWEWDAVVDNGSTPQGLQILASSPVYGMVLQDAGNSRNGTVSKAIAHTTRYITPGSAIVFSSGTIQWSWGLGAQGVRVVAPDRQIQQITYNVLADMGVQPVTPTSAIILDGSSPTPIPNPSRPSVTAVSAGKIPSISNVSVTVDDRTATINWETDTETIGQIWVGEAANRLNGLLPTEQEYRRTHSISTRLPYNSLTYFRIAATDKNWQTAFSETGSFQVGFGTVTPSRIRQAISDGLTAVQCWALVNPPGAAGVGGAALVGVTLVGWQVVRWRRQRARRSEPSAKS